MFRRKNDHRDMADVNIYTAKKLNEMALSLEGLAKAFSDEISNEGKLSKEDGLAAMQTAASMVCGDCCRCNVYLDSRQEENYYLYYLLRAFEQKGRVDDADMPRLFQETCKRQEDYVGQLNRSLGKATMNLTWKNRFLESRDAVITQFRELALILEEFSSQMEQAVDITTVREQPLRKIFRKHHVVIENLLILEYQNHQKEAFITAKTNNGRCVTTKDAAEWIGQVMGSRLWEPAKDSKTLITRQTATVRFVESGAYHMLYGVARTAKEGEVVSGDNYTFGQRSHGQVIMSLSDGMGSGETASRESQKVIELTEQLLEAGFSSRAALKLVNTVLLVAGIKQHPTTMDLCCVDLHTGVLESMKLGAVSTFIIHEETVDVLEEGAVPMGVLHTIEPVLLSKKLWDNDRVIMVTDGVLDVLPGDDKEQVLKEFLESMPKRSPQDMADRILQFAASFTGGVKDDMTVLTAGIWKRK